MGIGQRSIVLIAAMVPGRAPGPEVADGSVSISTIGGQRRV